MAKKRCLVLDSSTTPGQAANCSALALVLSPRLKLVWWDRDPVAGGREEEKNQPPASPHLLPSSCLCLSLLHSVPLLPAAPSPLIFCSNSSLSSPHQTAGAFPWLGLAGHGSAGARAELLQQKVRRRHATRGNRRWGGKEQWHRHRVQEGATYRREQGVWGQRGRDRWTWGKGSKGQWFDLIPHHCFTCHSCGRDKFKMTFLLIRF